MATKAYKTAEKQAAFEAAIQKAKDLQRANVQITTKYCNRDEQISDYANTLGISYNMAAKVRAYMHSVH